MSCTRQSNLFAPTVLAFAGVALLSSTEVRAERPPRVGVVVAIDVNMSKNRQLELSQAVGAALERAHPVEVVAGWEVERRLPPEGIPTTCISSKACLDDLIRRLDADELLMLAILQVGGDIQLDPTWYHAGSNKTLSRSGIRLDADEQDLAKVFDPIGAELRPPDPQRPERAAAEVPTPAAAATATTTDADTASATPAPPPRSRHLTTGTAVAAGVAATALLAGVGFTLTTRRLHQDCDPGPCDDRDRDRVRRHALAADVLFGVAAASTLTAAVLYYRSNDTPTPTKPEVLVTATPSGVGLLVRGSF
ncbi:hypothetical protein [Haliangium sp.]|uniref:hypothetical protein n=1 Tax=Haliangium sp. TaxID=2663208 RepID=UPI003D14E238